jgi:hypothetical protein
MRHDGFLNLQHLTGLILCLYLTSLPAFSQTAPNRPKSKQHMESTANQKTSLKAILAEKKDKRRVLLIYGRDDAQHFTIAQQEALNADELAERDLDVIVLVASTLAEPDRQFLMQDEFKLVPAEDFQGWLIGKDGGVKHRFQKPIDPKELYGLIDQMPMRKAEKN